jgi:hypothetical protein
MHIRSALLLTLILSNSGAAVGLHLHDAASELIGSVCLCGRSAASPGWGASK